MNAPNIAYSSSLEGSCFQDEHGVFSSLWLGEDWAEWLKPQRLLCQEQVDLCRERQQRGGGSAPPLITPLFCGAKSAQGVHEPLFISPHL